MRESEAAGREQSGCPTPKHLHRLLYRPIDQQQSRTKGESNPSIFSLNAQRCVCLCVCACVCTCVCTDRSPYAQGGEVSRAATIHGSLAMLTHTHILSNTQEATRLTRRPSQSAAPSGRAPCTKRCPAAAGSIPFPRPMRRPRQ